MSDQPFDLARAVTENDPIPPFRWTWDGEEFELPGVLDVVAISFVQAGDLAAGLACLLGEEQWRRLGATPSPFGAQHLQALFQAYGDHLGTPLEKSRASSRSSGVTARPSKRTSNGSTGSRSRASAARA